MFVLTQSSSQPAELYQDIALSTYNTTIANRTQTFSFLGQIQRIGENFPVGRYIVEYRSASGTVLDKFDSGYTLRASSRLTVTYSFANTQVAPVGTQSARIRLLMDKSSAFSPISSSNRVYFDAISFSANNPAAAPIPEPALYLRNLVTASTADKLPLADFRWITTNGQWTSDGRLYCFEQLGVQPCELYQDINLTNYQTEIQSNKQSFDFSGFIDGASGQTGRIRLEFRDSNGFALNTYDTGAVGASSNTQYTHSQVAPNGTRSIRIRLIADKTTSISPRNVLFDDLSFIAQAPLITPMPAPPIQLPNITSCGCTNGRDGIDGRNGTDGRDGRNGRDGIDGRDGINGRDGTNGRNGVDGRNGTDGIDGRDGTSSRDGASSEDSSDGGLSPVPVAISLIAIAISLPALCLSECSRRKINEVNNRISGLPDHLFGERRRNEARASVAGVNSSLSMIDIKNRNNMNI